MFQHLLESQAIATPRVGGSIASTIVHATVVGVLVVLTAQSERTPHETREVDVKFLPPVESVLHVARPSTTSSSSASSSSTTAPTVAPVIPLTLVEIPDGLAAIDLTRAVLSDGDISARGQRQSGDGGFGTRGPGDGGANGQPWLEHQVDAPVVLAAGAPSPTYPNMLREAGISGEVTVEFVVDTIGRVENGSVRIVSATHEPFAAAVRANMPRLRFLPAKAQGRAVRQLVRLPFRFALQ